MNSIIKADRVIHLDHPDFSYLNGGSECWVFQHKTNGAVFKAYNFCACSHIKEGVEAVVKAAKFAASLGYGPDVYSGAIEWKYDEDDEGWGYWTEYVEPFGLIRSPLEYDAVKDKLREIWYSIFHVKSIDIVLRNLGIKNGKIVFIDFGLLSYSFSNEKSEPHFVSLSKSIDNIKAGEQIKVGGVMLAGGVTLAGESSGLSTKAISMLLCRSPILAI